MKDKLLLLTTIILILTLAIATAQNPTADFRCSRVYFDTTTHICTMGFEDFSHDSDGSVLSQVWDFGDPASGAANSSTAHFVYHYYPIGIYTVTFSVIDNDGNKDTLRANNCIIVDALDCYCNYATSITELSSHIRDLSLSPNPTEDFFTINLNSELRNAQAEIYNMLGDEVYSTAIISTQQTINEKFPLGIYIVKVTDGEKQFIQKLIVQ